MCDWGGGPNEIQNYLHEPEVVDKVYTIVCPECPKKLHVKSITYWDWDIGVKEHLKTHKS